MSMTASTTRHGSAASTGIPPPPPAMTSRPASTSARIASISITASGCGEATTRR